MSATTKPLPSHLWEFEGDLYSERLPDKFARPLRRRYAWHFREIEHGKEVVACLRAGEWTFPGCYTCFFITSDGDSLSFDAVRKNLRAVVDSIRTQSNDGWRVVGLECEVNVEEPVYCGHTGKLICGEEVTS